MKWYDTSLTERVARAPERSEASMPVRTIAQQGRTCLARRLFRGGGLGQGGAFPILATLCVVVLAGCRRTAPSPTPDNPSRSDATCSTRPITAAESSQSRSLRVVSLAPHITEVVFALGQGARVVGVTSYCNYPPEARQCARCGGAMNTDLERILSLRPDLILVHGEHPTAVRFCQAHKIRMIRTDANDLAGLYDLIRKAAEALGCPDRGEALIAKMQADIDRTRAAVAGRPPVKTFLSMSRPIDRIKSLYTTNGSGFVSEMLRVAGGQNVFASTAVRYPKIEPAELLRRKPDAIIELQPGKTLTDEQRRQMTAQWSELGTIPATAGGRILFITADYAMIPGPRMPLLARRLAELLHPDLAGKLD